MPPRVTASAGRGRQYANPFIHGELQPYSVPVDITTLTNAEIDSDGMLKPGTPIAKGAGATYTKVAATKYVSGVTFAPQKVAAGNAAADIAAAGTVDVTIGAMGLVNRKIAENNLARVYTADELAGFLLAGSLLRLVF